MDGTLSEVMKLAISLISILNPLGAIPTFLALTSGYNPKQIKKISTTCSIAVFITIIVSLVLGAPILGFFGIGLPSFRIGGGILIAIMALSMLNGSRSNVKLSDQEMIDESNVEELGIVPLAIPLLAGPGTISTCVIHAEHINSTVLWIGAFLVSVIMGILIYYVLAFSRTIGRKMGTVGLNVMTRIMGLLLMARAIEFITSGIKIIFPKIG